MDNVFATLWGLIAFAGFVTALLIPKTDEYGSRYRESVEDSDREVAARWSAAVRTVPVAVLAGVVIIVAAIVATAGWGTQILGQSDFWMLVVSVVAQAGFAFTVRYLVAPVPAAFARIDPVKAMPGRDLRSPGGGARVSLRFDNDTGDDLVIDWINRDGLLAGNLSEVIARGDHTTRVTYAGHLWRVSTAAGAAVATFAAPAEPAVAAVTPSMLRTRP